jgi:hypothetical protein
MTSLYYGLPGLLIAFGLFRIAQTALPDRKAVTAIRNIHGKRDMAERLQSALLPVARFFSRRFPMSEYKAKRMEADFSRLGLAQSPSEYVGAAMAKSMLLAVIGLLFVPLGVPCWLLSRPCRPTRILSGDTVHPKTSGGIEPRDRSGASAPCGNPQLRLAGQPRPACFL